MPLIKKQDFIIITMSLYFGWLLSFPFHGPVLSAVQTQVQQDTPLVLIFSILHCLSYLLGGLLLKDVDAWPVLLRGSTLITLGCNLILLLLPHPWVWRVGMGLLGVSSAVFVLGWSSIYSLGGPTKDRYRVMALVIIFSNIILWINNILSQILPLRFLLVMVCIPLALLLFLLLGRPHQFKEKLSAESVPPLPKTLVIVFSLLIFALYLNGGFMYKMMIPILVQWDPFFPHISLFIYILVLAAIYFKGSRIKENLYLYMGVSLLGLAFVSFALMKGTPFLFILTTGLIESAFALLDLFIWTILGILAGIYRAPYIFFGLTMAAQVASILVGDMIGVRLEALGQNYRLITAIFTATSIFLTFGILPWLNERMERNRPWVSQEVAATLNTVERDGFDTLQHFLLPGQKLTPRETEITKLILQGLTNQDIAQELYISINTLKTHLKNIYRKFGVGQKRELLSLLTRKEKNSPGQ